ncbi:LytTR family DNA-binding domain-containing protein [Dokdonella sp.]|uniref:LytR/AlgR family response regulator transcription factor n=1 Tax=Dokdonella sp. TaxID=2291710 RepID=UPI0025C166AA|nr:LytTR family DNA-binding domain-containing protein [Dokdonella sp.]MBX3689150.1 response regulator transcription factor [Dokdonella sp.]
MKTLIVDDEPLARERLRALLTEVGGNEVVGEAANGSQALTEVARLAPDLVLLDIRMPGMDGLEAARHLAGFERPPAVVFCTAYGDHALEAFEANAVDYLLKPVRSERLKAALDKARRWSPQLAAATLAQAAGESRARSHLCARMRGNLVLIPIDEIHYLLAEDKYVVVRHGGGEVLIEEPLKALEDEFGERFVRIHRNCLVARARLSGLTRDAEGRLLAVINGVDAPLEVSRRNLPALRKLIKSL